MDPAPPSLNMTVRQLPETDVGFTQPIRVNPVVRSSEFESATVTQSLTPSKVSAPPYLPTTVATAPDTVPTLLLPEPSATDEPLTLLNEYAATKPEGGGPGALLTVTSTGPEVVRCPAPSRATAVRRCEPFEAVFVSH